MTAMTHFPLDPLLELATPSVRSTPRGSQPVEPFGRPARVTSLARAIGVAPRTVHRWNHDGVPTFSADRAAVALGRHPSEVWGDDWWADELAWGEIETAWRQWREQGERT